MTWTNIINDLLQRGYTFAAIGKHIGTTGAAVRAMAIKAGHQPRWITGNELISLHKDEKNRALMEAHQIAATDDYFAARPQIDCNDRRRVFEAGFQRAWNAALSHRYPCGRLVQSEPFAAMTEVPNAELNGLAPREDHK